MKPKGFKKKVKEAAYSAKHTAWNEIHNLGESILPTLKSDSRFEEGILTPEQFITAGDELIYKCMSWNWVGCKKNEPGYKSFLPLDKQYIQIKSVPCEKRAKETKYDTDTNNVLRDIGDGWNTFKHNMNKSNKLNLKHNNDDDDDDIKDIDDIDDIEQEQEQEFNIIESEITEDFLGFEEIQIDEHAIHSNILPCRRYDISITYDNYYRTPRVWLSGYNEYGIPLNSQEIEEDIMAEYVNRTVTLEAFPYSLHIIGLTISIHPCKHAETMAMFIKRSGIKPHEYIFTFLKFINSIVPTINYDFTGSIFINRNRN